ncbi:MAG: HDOD domain-containing protein [Burkholderiales bacterium]|nr:HDOD domain-containing protein [Burkholderiales bacterium]
MLAASTTAPDRRRLLAAIVSEIGQGGVCFPTTPQLARGIRQALCDPDCPVGTAARLVGAEPLLAARIVGLANSVLFRSRGRVITDLSSAITRVGFSVVRSLATALIVRQLAAIPARPAHRDMAAALWGHSAHAAALAYLLARRITGQNPDTALFAGLVHEAGGFYLISRAGDYPGLLDGALTRDWVDDGCDDAAESVIGGRGTPTSFQSRIGRAVLDALEVPAPVTEAIETLWRGELALPPRTLGDTLLLAVQLVPLPSPFKRVPEGGALHAQAVMDLAFEQGALGQIVKEAAADVASLSAILRG